MNHVTCLVVVYNKSINDSITLNHLKEIRISNIDTIVIDNSEKDYENEKECIRRNIRYISMGGNAGLSKAYNKGIQEARQDTDFIVLLDDDTEINENYFECLEKAAYEHSEVDVFAPIIIGQDQIVYSPNKSNFLKNKLVDENTEILDSEFNGIASCLAIRKRIFNDYKFNEVLFVDQVDQNFFDEQRNLKRKFMRLNIKINQNFYQRGAKLDKNKGWARLKLRLIDITRHARLKKKLRYKFIAYIKNVGLGLQIAKKSKSVGVFFKAFLFSTYLFFCKV